MSDTSSQFQTDAARESIAQLQKAYTAIRTQMAQVIVGQTEVIDQLLKRAEVRKLVQERLGPRVVALIAEATSADLAVLLEAEGVYLEGEPIPSDAAGNGGGGGNGSGNGVGSAGGGTTSLVTPSPTASDGPRSTQL